MHWLISIEGEPYHDSKLFTHSLNENKAKSRLIRITLVCVDVIYSHFRISVNCLNHFYWVSLAQMEIGPKHVLVIPSSLTLAGFTNFSAPTSFDTEYNLQPLVEPCCLRVQQVLLQWHGSDSYTLKGYKSEIRKAKYPIDSRNYRLLMFILRLPRYSLTFGFPWTRPSVHSPVYQWNNCSSNITRILSTILTRKYFDSMMFAYMRFSLSSSHALLEMKCDMQISYEMVSNAHVHQLTVSL